MTLVSKEYFLRHLFAKLEEEQIVYFVIGEYQFLPVDTKGSDVDIVIEQSSMDAVKDVFAHVIAECGVKLASYYQNLNENLYRFIGPKWGIQIDVLIDGLSYQGIQYFPIDKLKNHIILHNEIRVLEQQYGYYANFFKEMLHNGHVKIKYGEAFLSARYENEQYVKQDVIARYSSDTWDILSAQHSVEQLNIEGRMIRMQMLKSLHSQPSFLRQMVYQCKRLERLMQPRPGYVIVIEGTDGSGKSTIINAITPWLNEGFHNSVVYNHLRPHWLPDVAVLFGKRDADVKVEIVNNPHAGTSSGFVGSLVRWLYYMHDYTWGYLVKVWSRIRIRSYVYIFDRYYYDYYIDPRRSSTNLPHRILQFGEFFIPKPDIILCLGGDPEKIYARKPETSLVEVKRQTEELRRFAQKRKNAVWIDTTKPIDESIADAKSAILAMMSKRFKDVL